MLTDRLRHWRAEYRPVFRRHGTKLIGRLRLAAPASHRRGSVPLDLYAGLRVCISRQHHWRSRQVSVSTGFTVLRSSDSCGPTARRDRDLPPCDFHACQLTGTFESTLRNGICCFYPTFPRKIIRPRRRPRRSRWSHLTLQTEKTRSGTLVYTMADGGVHMPRTARLS